MLRGSSIDLHVYIKGKKAEKSVTRYLKASRKWIVNYSISNEVDETGDYYTEWSKPERNIPIQYTNTYMEFRKMVTIPCIRDSKRDTDV